MNSTKQKTTAESRAIFPGSFDPPTIGHIDLIKRALTIFDHLIILISTTLEKNPMFTLQERMKMLRELFGDNDRITIDAFKGLTVEYARKNNIHILVRGLRATSDFEHEFQLALANRNMAHEIETVYLPASPQYSHIRSSLIKEIAVMGGDIAKFVPPVVAERIKRKTEK